MMITKKGYARLNRSQISTGLMAAVVGRLPETERYTEARTIMQVILTVITKPYLSASVT